MNQYSLYVVDDENVARQGLALALKKNYRVMDFDAAEPAIEAMERHLPDIILLDIGLPGMSGIEALEVIKERYPTTLVIMITAFEDVKTVVSAMKLGAYDYVVKPIQMEALKVILGNAVDSIRMKMEIQDLHEKYLKENIPCFVGESDAIQDVMDVVDKVAQSPDTPILIAGETGTGKELIARAIHFKSPNSKGSLVTVNCAAIPRELIESELFGYEKGAFSGANKSGKVGLVEEAANGTLFLDEVGDLSLEAQAKLLRFLDEGEYYRVGSARVRSVKTRLISATNKNLLELVDEGKFRVDLYHRFAVVKLEIPSLNQRRDDIMPIARHYLREFSEKFGKSVSALSAEAEKHLKDFEWTGNVRELKNRIERGVLMGHGPELTSKDLGLGGNCQTDSLLEASNSKALPPISSSGVDLPEVIDAIEEKYFNQALKLSRGNESKAAQLLNLTRDKFRYRRQKLAL
jgi:DNA-binding NtrC family response regulator